MTIRWLQDLFILAGCMSAFIIGFVVVSACRLSSMISRDEEERELRDTFDNLNRAA